MQLIATEHGIKYRTPRVKLSPEETSYWIQRLRGPRFSQPSYPAVWDLMRQYGVTAIGGEWVEDAQTGNPVNQSVTQRRPIDADSQFVALELWAILGYAQFYYQIGEGNVGDRVGSFYLYMYPDQPSAIAGNDTTLAAHNGNYKFRNQLVVADAGFAYQLGTIDSPASGTYAVQTGFAHVQPLAFWQEPLRVVGPNLELRLHQETESGIATGDSWDYNYTLAVIGRYVEIGVEEYARLAALITGQAILPQPMIGP